MRGDLIAVNTHHRNESAVVVKDPVALKYYRLRLDEFFVLQSLDGSRSLDELCQSYETEYSPVRVTHSQMNDLLFRFHQSGLTTSRTLGQGEQLEVKRARESREKWIQHLTSLLFIRFPGVDPERFLRRFYPWIRPLLHPLSIVSLAALCLCVGMLFLTHIDRFSAEFPSIGSWLRFEAIIMLAAVIGGTKVLHELGHAFVCKHFGGECHTIGPMLLVFTPALYCDTSDAWMMPSRWQRAAVGIAGIATEVVLASIATIVWMLTGEGVLHSIMMNVMLVCGVSTVLFNANPLLRYDGYYVLSDLVDVPNLGERSRRLLTSYFNRFAFGIDEGTENILGDTFSTIGRWALVFYAIAAACYRWMLTLLIFYILSLMLRPVGLESIGRVLVVLAGCSMGFALLRGPIRFFRNPVRRGKIRMNRLLISAIVTLLLIAVAMYPFGSTVSCEARVLPRNQKSIYVATSGLLEVLYRQPGDRVRKGECIATFVNRDVRLKYLQAKGRFETQERLVASLKQSQFESMDAANELPAAQVLLEDLREQLDTRKSRLDGLVIDAPCDGVLISGPMRPDPKPQTELQTMQLVSWSGYPTDESNHACYLESGTELMSISRDSLWDVEIVLSQSDVQRVLIDAEVKLVLASAPSKIVTGKVVDISRSQWTAQRDAPRWDDMQASQTSAPPSVSYVVRAHLNSTDAVDSGQKFLPGMQATGNINAKPISLLGRIYRILNSILRFR